jgi:AcrR family transcriptional regulator
VGDVIRTSVDRREPLPDVRRGEQRDVVGERRAARRAELLAAAIAVIRRDGANATMEEMAVAGGISKPILYRHFNDREGLVSAIAEVALAELGGTLSEKLGEARISGSRSGVHATIGALFDYIEREPELYRFVVDQDLRLLHPASVAFTEEISKHVAAALRDGLAEAGRDTACAEVWGRGVVGMVQTTAAWWAQCPDVDRASVVDHLADLAWTGISGPPGAPA